MEMPQIRGWSDYVLNALCVGMIALAVVGMVYTAFY